MKKLIASLITVLALSAAVYMGTKAYFSDTETSVGNTITAGTIDIAVDGENPWEATYSSQLTDMKPGDLYAKEVEFTISNVGTNPVVIWKKVVITDENTGVESEPECTDQGGIWINPNGPCDWQGNNDNNNISSVISYSMKVDGVSLIMPEWGYTFADMDGVWVPLGNLEPGTSMVVTQNYKMNENAGNEYQGDEMVFDYVLYAEQYMASGPKNTARGVVLENKTGDPYWLPVTNDGVWAYLSWDASGNYTLKAYGLNTSVTYRIAYYNGSTETGVSGYVAPNADGSLTISGVYAGFNTNVNAKYWLRPSDWDNAKTLWEANLVN